MLSKLLRTSIISSALALITLPVISLKSLAWSYRTVVITNNNSLPISKIRIRPVNTKGKWHQVMPLADYLDEGRSKTFTVRTDQCKHSLVIDYINNSMSPGVLNVCGGDKTTPIKINYTGIGGTHDLMGKYIGDNPDCQHINSWVSGIRAPADPSCR